MADHLIAVLNATDFREGTFTDAVVSLLASKPHLLGFQDYAPIKKIRNQIPQSKSDSKAERGRRKANSLFLIRSSGRGTHKKHSGVIRSNQSEYTKSTIQR